MRDKSGKREDGEHCSPRCEFLLLSCSLISSAILSGVKPLQFRDTRIIASREWAVNGRGHTSYSPSAEFSYLLLLDMGNHQAFQARFHPKPGVAITMTQKGALGSEAVYRRGDPCGRRGSQPPLWGGTPRGTHS